MFINPNNKFSEKPTFPYPDIILKLKALGKPQTVEAGEIVLHEGGISDFLFFVESGAFRAYRWENDREVNIGFTFAEDIDSCPYSLIHDLPSRDTIQALCRSEILKVYKWDINVMLREEPRMKDFLIYMLSTYVETLVGRFVEFKAFTAEEIYDKLLERQPYEIAEVPLMHLASYLGISKERLSRIRRKYQLT